ncbi:MAG: bifunctional adenosylcobinamide kinase/adenosylcobinamide-phosphate guanylyltransferase [Pirellula staleyi]
MQVDKADSRGSIALIVGGVRSGKSRFAQELAKSLGGDDVLFVATAESRDGEMSRRIEHHRQSRPVSWRTLEQPLGTGAALAAKSTLPAVVLIDCMTLLVSNILCDGMAVMNDSSGEREIAAGIHAVQTRVQAEVDAILEVAMERATTIIIVSGEVGAGIVPEHALGRAFRDLLGWANQCIAKQAAVTYWMIAGLPINASALATSIEDAAIKLCQGKRQENQVG